jgi:hypothetical protein
MKFTYFLIVLFALGCSKKRAEDPKEFSFRALEEFGSLAINFNSSVSLPQKLKVKLTFQDYSLLPEYPSPPRTVELNECVTEPPSSGSLGIRLHNLNYLEIYQGQYGYTPSKTVKLEFFDMGDCTSTESFTKMTSSYEIPKDSISKYNSVLQINE